MHAHFKTLFGKRALNLVTVGTAPAQPRTPLLPPPSAPLPGWWVETREAKVPRPHSHRASTVSIGAPLRSWLYSLWQPLLVVCLPWLYLLWLHLLWQPLLVVDPLTARTSAELMPLHNAIAIRVARHGPASNPSSPRPSPPSSPRPSTAPSFRSSEPSLAMCEAAAERVAIERAAVGCEVLIEWMAGRLDPAHPFLLDYARLHVGRQYREALIRMIGRSSR